MCTCIHTYIHNIHKVIIYVHTVTTHIHTRPYVDTFIAYVQHIHTFFALHTNIHTHTFITYKAVHCTDYIDTYIVHITLHRQNIHTLHMPRIASNAYMNMAYARSS